MMQRRSSNSRRFKIRSSLSGLSFLLTLLTSVVTPGRILAEAPAASVSAFNSYIGTVESRLAQQHRSQNGFLVSAASGQQGEMRLRQGELIIEQITPSVDSNFSGALLHHWRGTAFVPGAKAADFERLMKDFNAYPRYFSPQVVQAKILSQQQDHLHALMRVRQQHVITVVMDTSYEIDFGRLDPRHGYSISRSSEISEIGQPGTAAEHALSSSQEHGFLWRLNTYWSYVERDGGLYMQIESVSLTRAIPRGLDWALRPFVLSVPRESLEFTLRSAGNALRK